MQFECKLNYIGLFIYQYVYAYLLLYIELKVLYPYMLRSSKYIVKQTQIPIFPPFFFIE